MSEKELRVARAGHLTCTPRPFACTAHPRGFESRANSGALLIERVPSPTDRRAGRRRATRPDELNKGFSFISLSNILKIRICSIRINPLKQVTYHAY